MKDTIRRLEFDKILDLLADQASFYGGRERALALTPATDFSLVQLRLAETEETMALMHFQEPTFLNDLQNVRPYLAKSRAQGVLYPADLLEVLRLLKATRAAQTFLARGDKPRALSLHKVLVSNRELEEKLEAAIDDSGQVKDSATPELKSIRSRMEILRHRIKDYLRDFVKSAHNQKFLQDALITERGGRYVVPVKQEYRHEIKGIVHDESASGATVFIEPAVVVDSNNEIRRLELEERREVEKILRQLSMLVGVFSEELEDNLDSLELLDLWVAKARLAIKMDAYLPRLNSKGRIRLQRARHPLLGDKAVPIDLEMGDRFDILVLTGPNTGGKTVTLKCAGLLTLMIMSGLFVPTGPDSELSVFSKVLVDIGDEQSIEQSLSTFSSHMINIISILEQAGKGSLVILDELGAGTDPLEGAALARAILEKMLTMNARVLVSTHHSELKAFAYQHSRVENACVEFDPVSLRPTYRLTIGIPGQSNAFEITRNLGMQKDIVERARNFVPQQEIETAQMLRELKELRFQAAKENEKAEALRQELEQERKLFEQHRKEVEGEREESLARFKKDTARHLDQVKREAEDALENLKQKIREAEVPRWHEIDEIRQDFVQGLPDVDIESEDDPEPGIKAVRPGDYVEIRSIGQKGYVVDEPSPSGDVVVQVGIMKLTVKLDDLASAREQGVKITAYRQPGLIDKRKSISPEINLLGKRATEALEELDEYIEEAFLAGLERVRVIHGKGTGALRKAIREHLKGHPYVESFQIGEQNEGGLGVTIVRINQ
ncbi:MAG: endonuclease MutS2 [Chitinophagales bacterium]